MEYASLILGTLAVYYVGTRVLSAGLLAAIARISLLAMWGFTFTLALMFTFMAHERFPHSWIALLPFAAIFGYRVPAALGWSHGTARTAEIHELAEAGYLDDEGLPLGKIRGLGFVEATRYLFSAPAHASMTACRLWFASPAGRGLWVHSRHHVHLALFAPPGAGKSQGFIIPMLRSCRDTLLALDIKAELIKAAARFREKMFGHVVYVFDPMRFTGVKAATLNLLDFLDTASITFFDDVLALANDLVVKTGKEQDPHWNACAEQLIAAVTAFVCLHLPSADRTLPVVYSIIANPLALQRAIKAMQEVGCPTLQAMGDQLSHLEGRELNSVLTTALRHLAFVNTPAMRDFLSKSTVNPRALVEPKTTSFFAVPPDKLQSLAPLTRAFFGCITRLIAQTGLKNRRIQIVLDEAASLSRLESIENGIAQLRGSGARYTFAFQAEKQLEKCLPEQAETFQANMSLKVYFGVNDYATAKNVSEMAGDYTVRSSTSSGGINMGGSTSGDGGVSNSWGRNSGWSNNEVARKLWTPDEILAFSHRTAIIFTQDTRPFLTRLVHAYEPDFQSRKRFSPFMLTLKAVLLAAMTLAVTGPAADYIHKFAKGGPNVGTEKQPRRHPGVGRQEPRGATPPDG